MYAISPKGSLIVATADMIPIPTRKVPPGQRYRVTWQTPAPAAHPSVRHIRLSGQVHFGCVQHATIHGAQPGCVGLP